MLQESCFVQAFNGSPFSSAVPFPAFDQTKFSSVSGENSKSQIPNSKPVWDIGYWNLTFIWNLVLGIGDFWVTQYLGQHL
jgi:hypothetical protein